MSRLGLWIKTGQSLFQIKSLRTHRLSSEETTKKPSERNRLKKKIQSSFDKTFVLSTWTNYNALVLFVLKSQISPLPLNSTWSTLAQGRYHITLSINIWLVNYERLLNQYKTWSHKRTFTRKKIFNVVILLKKGRTITMHHSILLFVIV